MDRGYSSNDQFRARCTTNTNRVFFAKASHEAELESELNRARNKGCTCGRPERYVRKQGTWRFMIMQDERGN